jgi:hypothetical protein
LRQRLLIDLDIGAGWAHEYRTGDAGACQAELAASAKAVVTASIAG